MSLFSIKIRNYRNISYDNPIELSINKDITFIVGVNNVGKSNLLRMFYELKPAFARATLSSLRGTMTTHESLAVHADHILPQNSTHRAIELEFHNGNYLLKVKIEPRGEETHTNVFDVTFERKKLSSNDDDGISQSILDFIQGASRIPTIRIATNQGSAQQRDILVGPDLLN